MIWLSVKRDLFIQNFLLSEKILLLDPMETGGLPLNQMIRTGNPVAVRAR